MLFFLLLSNKNHIAVAGLGNSEGSQKALNMLFAIRTIQERTGKDLWQKHVKHINE